MVLAAAAILAVGTTATGLDTAMDSSADDAGLLPEPIRELVTDTSPGDGQEETQAPEDGDGEQEEQSSDPEQSDQGNMDFENAMGEAQSKLDASMQNMQDMTSGGGGEGVSQATETLWDYLIYVLALAAVLVAGYLLYVLDRRYDLRSRISPFEKDDAVAPNVHFDVDTSNDVYRAWSEMVSQLHVRDPHTKTPQEFAEAAVEDGLNPEAVGTITTLFEQVLYGDQGVSEEQEARALEAMEKLDSEPVESTESAMEPGKGEAVQSTDAPATREAA